MTGATGNLTPDDSDEPFVSGERGEVGDPADQAAVTASQGRHAPAQSGDADEPGMDARPVAGSEDPGPSQERENRVGGDQLSDHEEHF